MAKSSCWLVGIALTLIALPTCAATYFIAPTGGSDTNNGSLGAPFATFGKAIGLATPGDIIFARGGTYNLNSTVSIGSSRSGTAANPIKLWAYPGEAPILDFRGQTYSASNAGQKGISLNGSYWHLKGLTVQYAADNGVAIGGSNNILEQLVARQNQDSGFQISGSSAPANNLILNSDSYANFDFGAGGENADGFAIKFRDLGPGNVVSGARAWENSDDGFDFWEAENGVTIKNSWVFRNGLAAVFNNPASYAGDGNGLKLGKDSGTHTLRNLLVWSNPANGVDINGNATEPQSTDVAPHGVTVDNVTAAFNGGSNFRFDENPTLAAPPTQHLLRNNISYSGSVNVMAGNTAAKNTFAGPGGTPAGLGVTAADFISTALPILTPGSYRPAGVGGDRDGTTTPVHATGPAVAPRLADGSLPFLDFLRLSANSHLIDAGMNVGQPFNGTAPDVGYLETAAPLLLGDYNANGMVDAADYTLFADNLGASVTLPNDQTPGAVTAADYTVWLNHFGQTLGASSAVSVAVPEPASVLLAMMALISAARGLACNS